MNLPDLLSTCFLLRQQTATLIQNQLEQLRQHTACQFAMIRQQERLSSMAQTIALDQVRLHLATDARLLLSAPEFVGYVEDLKQEPSSATLIRQVTVPIQGWVLPTVSVPLQLHDIETRPWKSEVRQGSGVLPRPCAAQTCLRAQIQNWQQVIQFPAILYEDEPRPSTQSMQAQWRALREPLKAIEAQLDVASFQRSMLVQELFCLFSFASELFNLREIATQMEALQSYAAG